MTVEAVIHPHGDGLIADCRLLGRRSLPNQTEPQVTTHFTARVRLAKHAPALANRAGRWAGQTDTSSKPPTSTGSTSTARRTRLWSGHGGMESGSLA